MNKITAAILMFLGFGGALLMYQIGSTNSRLTELLDFFWLPIPLGVIGLLGLIGKKPESTE